MEKLKDSASIREASCANKAAPDHTQQTDDKKAPYVISQIGDDVFYADVFLNYTFACQ
jgi:hypothetical protein